MTFEAAMEERAQIDQSSPCYSFITRVIAFVTAAFASVAAPSREANCSHDKAETSILAGRNADPVSKPQIVPARHVKTAPSVHHDGRHSLKFKRLESII